MSAARERWMVLCTRANRIALSHELRSLEELEKRWGPRRLAWAVVCYGRETFWPSIRDFSEWLERNKADLPEGVVAAAYLSEDPTMVKMADKLETLKGSWFPDEALEAEISDLERRLKGALL